MKKLVMKELKRKVISKKLKYTRLSEKAINAHKKIHSLICNIEVSLH